MPYYFEFKVKELDLEPVSVTLSPAPSWVSVYKYNTQPFDQFYGTYDITIFLVADPPPGTPDGTYSIGITLSDFLGGITTHSVNFIINTSGTITFDPASVPGLWGWWQPGNWLTQSGDTYNDVAIWYDASPGAHHLTLDRRMTILPWNSTNVGSAYVESYIKTLSDNSLLFSWSHVNHQFANMNYSSGTDNDKPENVLITKDTSFYSNQYSIFFVYRNHLDWFSHRITGMSLSITRYEYWATNIWDFDLERGNNNLAMPVYSPVVINRAAPYTTVSYGSGRNDDYDHGFVGGWFIAFCLPPYAADPSARDAYYYDDGGGLTTMSVFNYAPGYYQNNVPHQPYITIFKVNKYASQTDGSLGIHPIKLFYYTNEEYASMSLIERNNRFSRFVFTKDQWNAVGYIVEENPLISNSVVIGYSYTYSIYFNETTSVTKSLEVTFYDINGNFRPPTTYAYIDGSDNQQAYIDVYGGFGIGTRFATAQSRYYAYVGGATGWRTYNFTPGVFSLSFKECLFYTRALWNEAPQIMDYLMKKHGIPFVS